MTCKATTRTGEGGTMALWKKILAHNPTVSIREFLPFFFFLVKSKTVVVASLYFEDHVTFTNIKKQKPIPALREGGGSNAGSQLIAA